MGSSAAAGGRLRDRLVRPTPAPVFGLLGLALVGAGLALPEFETLLVAWGGTALFLALLLYLVAPTATVPAGVATAVHAAGAENVRRLADPQSQRYVPDGDSVSLVVGRGDGPAADDPARTLTPVGERLLAPVTDDAPVEARAEAVLDSLVYELELVDRGRSRLTDEGLEVGVTGLRIGTEELFDHPVVSVVGVGLARAVGAPVTVETTVEDDGLTLICRWD